MRSKADLPSKTCAACTRPFAWRKKWARDWAAVKYCSERCRRTRVDRGDARPGAQADAAVQPEQSVVRR